MLSDIPTCGFLEGRDTPGQDLFQSLQNGDTEILKPPSDSSGPDTGRK